MSRKEPLPVCDTSRTDKRTPEEEAAVIRHRITLLNKLLHTAVGENRRNIESDINRENQALQDVERAIEDAKRKAREAAAKAKADAERKAKEDAAKQKDAEPVTAQA